MSNNFSKKIRIFSQKFSLDSAEVGKKYKIVLCTLPGEVKTRLAELGLVKDSTVVVLKKAPLGDPLEISVRGYSLCLRAKEAKGFTVILEEQ